MLSQQVDLWGKGNFVRLSERVHSFARVAIPYSRDRGGGPERRNACPTSSATRRACVVGQRFRCLFLALFRRDGGERGDLLFDLLASAMWTFHLSRAQFRDVKDLREFLAARLAEKDITRHFDLLPRLF